MTREIVSLNKDTSSPNGKSEEEMIGESGDIVCHHIRSKEERNQSEECS